MSDLDDDESIDHISDIIGAEEEVIERPKRSTRQSTMRTRKVSQDTDEVEEDNDILGDGEDYNDEDYSEGTARGKRRGPSKGSAKKDTPKGRRKTKVPDYNEDHDEEEDDDDDDDQKKAVPPLRIKLRDLRSKRSKKRKSSADDEEDDDDADRDDDTSQASGKLSSKADPAPSRRSERIFLSAAQKQKAAAEEEAAAVTGDEESMESSDSHCNVCRQSGELILCDYCPRAFHKVCLETEVTNDATGLWLCPHCDKYGKPEKKKQKKTTVEKKSVKKPAKTFIENQDYCEICSQCGELVLCDTCPRAYHLVCMDPEIKELPQGQWSCPYCEENGYDEREEAPEKEKAEKIVCKVCRGSGNIIFCASCNARFHPSCLNPPLDDVPDDWQCAPCSVEPLKGKVQRVITWRWKQLGQNKDEETHKEVSPKKRKRREREFFVKWRDMSYWHCSWISEIQLQVFHPNMFRSFSNKNDMNVPPPLDDGSGDGTTMSKGMADAGEGISAATGMKNRRLQRKSRTDVNLEEKYYRYGIRPEWLQIHRILNHKKQRGKYFYTIKWRELPYDEATLELDPDNCEFEIADYRKCVDDYWALRESVEEEANNEKKGIKKPKDTEKRKKGRPPLCDPRKKYEKQPAFIPAPLELHPYQLEGVNWLRYSWAAGTETILADEMGLGKTIQTISFLYSLYKEGHTRGPFLITAPLSTIINWERELEDWAPDFYVVNYTGHRESRIIIRENELSFDSDAIRSSVKASRVKKTATVKFHVLLTSYELINVDSAMLASIDWKVLVVDEAHRLKSNQSLFFRTLNSYSVAYKLLLTGTPLQNNLEELFNLLNFLSPERFDDMNGFLNEFAEIAKEEQVKKLHDMLGPHLLRRLKADVLTGIPAKSEFIVRIDLAPLQKKYYKYILTRNFEALNVRGRGRQCSLLNIMMDLKKCCNHPYLFATASTEAPKTKTGFYEGTALTKGSGKLIVLQKMLKKLKADGHRVLIFSQMTLMLDLLEEFLEAEGYRYERIDGAITGSLRQDAIDRFNAPNAQQFVFLLSTRAGGLGINLATADTVIIYDSDWNPHNDIQALSRAHRIGQANKVMIYRFVTRGSVEERITHVAKKKMMLTHLVVRPGLGSRAQASMTKQELDDILKFGTEELFKEEEGKEDTAIHYDDKAIEELLDRSKEGIEQKEMIANDYLSSFKVASYGMKEAEKAEMEEEQENKEKDNLDPQYWEKLLGAHYIQYQENVGKSLGKGKRVRKQVNYSGQDDFTAGNESAATSSDYSGASDVSSNDEDYDMRMEDGVRGTRGMRSKHGKEKMPPLVAVIGGNTEILGFTAKHRKAFLDVVMRFGLPPQEVNITESQWYVRDLKGKSERHLRAYASMFVSHLCVTGDTKSNTFDDGVPKEGLNVNHVLARIGIVSLIRKKVHHYESKHGVKSMPKKIEPKIVHELDDHANGDANKRVTNEGTSILAKHEEEKIDEDNDGDEKKDEKMDIEKEPEVNPENQQNGDDLKDKNVERDALMEESNEKDENEKIDDDAVKDIVKDDVKEKCDDNDDESILKENDKKDDDSNIDKNLNDDKENAEDSTINETSKPEESKVANEVELFDFNIRDGGLTELHVLWFFEDQELKPGKELEIWHRRHDYWLLAGIVKHGYARWREIHEDEDLRILWEPFKNSLHIKNKFMERRLRLLEQALVMEEQLRRSNHLNKLTSDEKQQESDEESKDSDEKEEKSNENEKVNDENKPLNRNIHRVVNHIEELLNDMKSDCGRIPQTVQRIPPIAQRLQLSQKGFNTMAAQKSQIIQL